jgi:hypothetical protein
LWWWAFIFVNSETFFIDTQLFQVDMYFVPPPLPRTEGHKDNEVSVAAVADSTSQVLYT